MIPLFLFLTSFVFYLTGASVSLDGGDSGEFIASSFTLGIPHAPGYPLIQLLGKSAQVLLPFSTPSYRFHVFSALAVSFFLLVFYRLLTALFGREFRWWGLAAVLFLAVSPLVIEQARVAEVFGLHALFVVGILLACVKREFLLASFLFGLGLGNHHILLAVAPVLLVMTPSKLRGAAIAAFLMGLSIYFTLPIRARANPPVNFGDPETWSRFWAVFTRREFGSTALHPAALSYRDVNILIDQTRAFFGRAVYHLGWGGVVVMIAGGIVGLIRPHRRWLAFFALMGFLGLGWAFEIYSNLSPTSDIGQWRLERFFLIPLVSSIVLICLALEEASRRKVSMVITLACLAGSAWTMPRHANFRNNTAFRDFGTSVLRSAPKNARVIIDRVLFDEPTSSLLVAVLTENRRHDLRFYYRPGTLFEPVYGSDVLDLSWEGRIKRQQAVEADMLMKTEFPVRCLAFEKNNTPFTAPILEGFLYREGLSGSNLEPFRVTRNLQGSKDYPTRLIQVHSPYFLGKAALEQGRPLDARQWFDSALNLGTGMVWLATNIGGIAAQSDWLPFAEKLFQRAVEMDPTFFEAQYGWGFVSLKQGRWAQAVEAYRQSTKLAPSRAEGFYMLGLAHKQSGNAPDCRSAWQRYLLLEPRGKMSDVVRKEMEEMKWK